VEGALFKEKPITPAEVAETVMLNTSPTCKERFEPVLSPAVLRARHATTCLVLFGLVELAHIPNSAPETLLKIPPALVNVV
jgi:hypothetical protein